MLKLHTLFFVLLWTTFLVADEPSRTWTSRQGLTLQGVMIGVEDGMVLIKQPNGDMFKAKLDALSQADVDYVKAVSFGASAKPDEGKTGPQQLTVPDTTEKQPKAVPNISDNGIPETSVADDLFGDPGTTGKVVEVRMAVDPNPASPSVKEIGVSPSSKLNDQIALSITMADRPAESASHDSTWTLESLDSFSGTLKANTAGKMPLQTDGIFCFLTYSVKNERNTPLQIPIAIITDSKNRRFYPLSAIENDADAYIPVGLLYAEKSRLQPGLKKRFCSIYELPKDCVVSHIEIFPICMTRHPLYSTLIKSGQLKGKIIEINPSPTDSSSDASTTENPVPSTEKVSVFMSCRFKTQKTTSTYRQKTRILSYSIDLRLNRPREKEMTIKAYFIAGDKNGDGIINIVDQPVSLQQGKSFSTTVESKPISEGSGSLLTYSYGAKLKGVIIQLWADGNIITTWTSMPQWDKYAKMPDIQEKMRQIESKRPGEVVPRAQRGI